MPDITYSPEAAEFRPQTPWEFMKVIPFPEQEKGEMAGRNRIYAVTDFAVANMVGNFLGTYVAGNLMEFVQTRAQSWHKEIPVTEKEFSALVQKWRDETWFQSSPSRKYRHAAYQAIIGMGKDGIAFVLREFRAKPDFWFYALRLMAREDVSAGIENFEDARAAWITWGYRNNYL